MSTSSHLDHSQVIDGGGPGGGEKKAGSPISPKAGVYAVDDEEPQLVQEDSCAAQVLLEGNEKDKQMDSQEVELPGVIATA